MSRARTSMIGIYGQNLRGIRIPDIRIRNPSIESGVRNFGGDERKPNQNEIVLGDSEEKLRNIVREVCRITRTRARWEESLLSDFPSFDFSDPRFLSEFLREQSNVLISLRLFQWLRARYGVSPEKGLCSQLFEVLSEAKAGKVAKQFLCETGFVPEPDSLEQFVKCLCESDLVEEAFDVFLKLKENGFQPTIGTCNSMLFTCLKLGKTDLLWRLYEAMMESGIVANADADTVSCLIQAFCKDGQASRGYELLKQVLRDGLEPASIVYNKLVAGFCEKRNYSQMSDILHTMIARSNHPDIYTYQEVINGLCKRRKRLEGYWVFKDLNNRGYMPDRVMYTTMIHGLCDMGWLGEARKLWFEMKNKGLLPNEVTYTALIHGYYRVGEFGMAEELHHEMCAKGYKENIVSYNVMIGGLCLHGRSSQALEIFKGLSDKGLAPDAITYNSLIKALCEEGKFNESMKLMDELLSLSLRPSVYSYNALIKGLVELGDVEEAKRLWDDMVRRGLNPLVNTQDHLIKSLCKQGYLAESMEWLWTMLKNKQKPEKTTFESLIQCLAQHGRFEESLHIMEYMCRIGHDVGESISYYLVSKLCLKDPSIARICLDQVLCRC